MAENSYPFYGHETSEAEYSKLMGLVASDGVASGLALTAGAGMNVSVASGSALVRGRFYENTAAKNVAVSAAPGSGTRKDAIVLRADLTAKTIIVVAKDGSTAGGGTLPALTQDATTWEVLIGEVVVAAGTVSLTGGMITTRRPILPVKIYPYATNTDRPSPTEASALGFNTTSKIIEVWNGAAWSDLAVAWAGITGKPATFDPAAHDIDGAAHTGTLGIAKGGTGGATAAAARAALGVPSAADAATITGGTLDSARLPTVPITKGGTGATTKAAAREALGIFVRSAPLDGTNAVGDIRLW